MIRISMYQGVLILVKGSMRQIYLAGEEEMPSRLRPTALPKSMQVRTARENIYKLIYLIYPSILKYFYLTKIGGNIEKN